MTKAQLNMKSIDWNSKGDISREIHTYVSEKIDYWLDECEENPKNEQYQGILLALKNVLNFIER